MAFRRDVWRFTYFPFHFQSLSLDLFHLTFSFSLLLSSSPFPPFLCLSLSLFFFLGLKQQQKNISVCLLRCTLFFNNDELYTSIFPSKHTKHFTCIIFLVIATIPSSFKRLQQLQNDTTVFGKYGSIEEYELYQGESAAKKK